MCVGWKSQVAAWLVCRQAGRQVQGRQQDDPLGGLPQWAGWQARQEDKNQNAKQQHGLPISLKPESSGHSIYLGIAQQASLRRTAIPRGTVTCQYCSTPAASDVWRGGGGQAQLTCLLGAAHLRP